MPVLPGPVASRSYRGPLSKGTVLAAVAPAGRWSLVGPTGSMAPRASSFGWVARYQVGTAGTGTLRFRGGLVAPLSFVVSVVTWLVAVALLVGEGVGRPRRMRLRREGRRGAPAGPVPEDGADVGDAEGATPSTDAGSDPGPDAGAVAPTGKRVL